MFDFGGGLTNYIIVPIVAIVAGVVALMRSDRTLLREDNEDLRSGRADDKLEISDLKEKLAQANLKQSECANENMTLRELNSAQPVWAEVIKRLDAIIDLLLERKQPTRGSNRGTQDSA